jgi:hypothetical protein
LRRGNPGLEIAAPLGLKIRLKCLTVSPTCGLRECPQKVGTNTLPGEEVPKDFSFFTAFPPPPEREEPNR